MSLLQSKTPTCTHIGLGSSAFARRYSQNRFFFLFLRLLRCFSSPGSLRLPIQLTPVQQTVHKVSLCGFPHSDICGSMCICHSPQLFAAYHVFHRLSVPRHPPCALFSLTNNLKAVLIGLMAAEVYFPLPEERLDLICEAKDTKKALPSSNRFRQRSAFSSYHYQYLA